MMDIEKLIEKLQNAAGGPEGIKMCHDAATTISALRAENAQLRAELEQVKQESDAAVSDMETIMAYGGCNLDTCQYCKNGQCYVRGGTKLCLPKWRGPQKEG